MTRKKIVSADRDARMRKERYAKIAVESSAIDGKLVTPLADVGIKSEPR